MKLTLPERLVSDGLGNFLWSEADPFTHSLDEQLRFSWEHFCHIIKHERRYFFLHDLKKKKRSYDDNELFSPTQILRTIFSFAEQANAFVAMPAGAKLFRARYQPAGKVYATAGTLGPRPQDHSIKTNRMSPPGVVMTYAAEDWETALAETADEAGTFAVGEFVKRSGTVNPRFHAPARTAQYLRRASGQHGV
jgi:hypothetical protein